MDNNINCLITACNNLAIPYTFLDIENNVINITIKNKSYLFQLNKTPFNTESMAGICKDKAHTYQLLKDKISMPKTLSFLDWDIAPKYQHYVQYPNITKVLEKIEITIPYPIIIKPNKGALGRNVFLCKNAQEAQQAILEIFSKNSIYYDYIVLAQEYLLTTTEYRMVCFDKKAVLTYERSTEQSFKAQYWQQGHAKLLIDQEIIQQLLAFIQPALELEGLNYIGFDIVCMLSGEYKLLELNSGARFDNFIGDNGKESVVKMYEEILKGLYG